MHILSVIGTRPEAIKMAPIIRYLADHQNLATSSVCSTGQHREMLDQVLERFQIKVNVELALMRENQTLAQLTSRALEQVTHVLQELKPDLVLVQGDTTTAMVSALASFYQQIPVGHVEAGLRSFNRYSPFPEEINRRLISEIANYHFAPTKVAQEALRQEGIPDSRIFLTGNPVIDALYMLLDQPVDFDWPPVRDSSRIILVTAHRRENHGQPLEDICRALKHLTAAYPDVEVVFPVHLNPNVQKVIRAHLEDTSRIHLLQPVPYDVFVHLMQSAYLILTDSGGVQEEAPALGKPVLVLRNETERTEGIKAGVAKLIGTKMSNIIEHASQLLDDSEKYHEMSRAECPYGDGNAAERIIGCILDQVQLDVSQVRKE